MVIGGKEGEEGRGGEEGGIGMKKELTGIQEAEHIRSYRGKSQTSKPNVQQTLRGLRLS